MVGNSRTQPAKASRLSKVSCDAVSGSVQAFWVDQLRTTGRLPPPPPLIVPRSSVKSSSLAKPDPVWAELSETNNFLPLAEAGMGGNKAISVW